MPELPLARLELELRTVGSSLFEPERKITTIVFPTEDIQAAIAHRSPRKACVWLWQAEVPRDIACLAHVGEGSNATTPRVCRNCKIPDERVVCAHLMKPEIRQDKLAQGRYTRSIETPPGCGIELDPADGADCRIDGKECWERTLETHVASPLAPPPDLPRSVADELDFLRLVARERWRKELKDAVPIPQARSVSELFGRCDSAEDLQRRIAALGDLLNHLAFVDALPEGERKDEKGEKLKPLVALDKLLETRAPEVAGRGGPVADLRLIVSVRNTFPVHSQGKTGEDFRKLGIEYPPPNEDWHLAWTKILEVVWSSVRRVREALQTP